MYALRFVISIPFLTLLFCSCEQNEHPPTVEDQEFEVSESGYFFIQHPTIKASDADGDQNLSFKIVEGNEEGIFSVHSINGSLSLSRPEELDYETVSQHFFKVAVSDMHEKNPLESTAIIQINVRDRTELTDLLLAYYPSDGDAGDYQGMHTVERYGAQLYDDRLGQNESAVFFDGTDDYLAIPDHDDFSFPHGDLSISLWVQPLTHRENTFILSKGGGDQDREYALGIDSDSLFFVSVYNRRNSDEEYRCTSITKVNYSDWYHVTATWDGYMLVIYVNGERERSQACNAIPVNYASDLLIGTLDRDSHESSFHGVLDDLFIHGRVVDIYEFKRLYPEF